MTIQEIANNPDLRKRLEQLISDPAMQIALNALSDENMPDIVIKSTPNMDPLVAIALDSAKRGGAQSIIKKLRKLPFINPSHYSRSVDLGAPWEYLEMEAKPKAKTVG